MHLIFCSPCQQTRPPRAWARFEGTVLWSGWLPGWWGILRTWKRFRRSESGRGCRYPRRSWRCMTRRSSKSCWRSSSTRKSGNTCRRGCTPNFPRWRGCRPHWLNELGMSWLVKHFQVYSISKFMKFSLWKQQNLYLFKFKFSNRGIQIAFVRADEL